MVNSVPDYGKLQKLADFEQASPQGILLAW
jgi:hypothetical protein